MHKTKTSIGINVDFSIWQPKKAQFLINSSKDILATLRKLMAVLNFLFLYLLKTDLLLFVYFLSLFFLPFTYIHNWTLQAFRQGYDLASRTTYVVMC